MPLPASWVDSLFAKLSVRYGTAFQAMYRDLDPEAVKADWAEVLDGVSGQSIGYGLRYLPSDRPPNAQQFRDLCRKAPTADPLPALAAPTDRPDQARVQAVLRRLRDQLSLRSRLSPAQSCALRIREISAERGYMTGAQRHQLEAIERTIGSTDPGAEDQQPDLANAGPRRLEAVR